MGFDIRRIEKNDWSSVIELFRSERESKDSILWQDRSPELTQIFRHFQLNEAIYFGAYFERQLVGVTGIIPFLNGFGEAVWLDTDLFVAPAFRKSRAAYELVKHRFVENLANGPRCYWGIEENPHQLDICQKLGLKSKMNFAFIGTTKLQHEYLLTDKRLSEQVLHGVKIVKLADLSSEVIGRWLNLLPQRSPFLPRLDQNIFKRLEKLDPGGQAILTEDGFFAVLLSQSSARKFRFANDQSLIFKKMARFRCEKMATDQELRLGVVGLVAGPALGGEKNTSQTLSDLEGHYSWQKLTEGVAVAAQQRQFHVLVCRDLHISVSRFLPVHRAEFQRRVFIIDRPSGAYTNFCQNSLTQTQNVFIDSVFL